MGNISAAERVNVGRTMYNFALRVARACYLSLQDARFHASLLRCSGTYSLRRM